MKFWTRLRWIATAVFVALLLGSWLGTDSHPHRATGTNGEIIGRPAPIIH